MLGCLGSDTSSFKQIISNSNRTFAYCKQWLRIPVAHYMDFTVEIDGLLVIWVRWWAYSPILEVQILEQLQLSHGQTQTWLPGCTPYLRAARMRSRVATRVSSNFSIAWWHSDRQDDRFSAALFSRFFYIYNDIGNLLNWRRLDCI